MSTTAGHWVSGSCAAAAGARFGAQAGTAPGFGSGDSGSGSGGAASVDAISGGDAGGGDFGAELLGGTVFAAGSVFGDEVHAVGALFAAGGDSEGGAGGAFLVGAAAVGGTVGGGTVAACAVAGGTVAGGTVAGCAVAGGTVLAAGGWLAAGAPRGATGGGFHSDGVGPAGRSGSCASVSPNAEGGHAGIVCSVGGSGGQMSLCVGSSAPGCDFGGQVSGADLAGAAG